MSRALVVTGTDTGIGKTLFAGALDGVTIDPATRSGALLGSNRGVVLLPVLSV